MEQEQLNELQVGDIVFNQYRGRKEFYKITSLTEVTDEYGSSNMYGLLFANKEGKLYKNSVTETRLYDRCVPAQEYIDEQVAALEQKRTAYLKLSDAVFEAQNKTCLE